MTGFSVWLGCIVVAPLFLELGYRLSVRRSAASNTLMLTLGILTALAWFLCLGRSMAIYQQRIQLVHQVADLVAGAHRRAEFFPDLDRRWFRSQLCALLEVELAILEPTPNTNAEERMLPIMVSLMHHCATMKLPENYENRRENMNIQLNEVVAAHFRLHYALQEQLPGICWGVLGLLTACQLLTVGHNCLLEPRFLEEPQAGEEEETQSDESEKYRLHTKTGRFLLGWMCTLVCWVSISYLLLDFEDPQHGLVRLPINNLNELRTASQRDIL